MNRQINTLTVKELMEILADFDEEMPVVIGYPSHDYWGRMLVGEVGEHEVEERFVVWSNYHDQFQQIDDDETDEPDVVETEEVLVIGYLS